MLNRLEVHGTQASYLNIKPNIPHTPSCLNKYCVIPEPLHCQSQWLGIRLLFNSVTLGSIFFFKWEKVIILVIQSFLLNIVVVIL